MYINMLIKQWQEPGPLQKVKSSDICPDAANRAHTGLAVEHVHYVATCIRADGFKARGCGHPDPHDVPVLVRESAATLAKLANFSRYILAKLAKFARYILAKLAKFAR